MTAFFTVRGNTKKLLHNMGRMRSTIAKEAPFGHVKC